MTATTIGPPVFRRKQRNCQLPKELQQRIKDLFPGNKAISQMVDKGSDELPFAMNCERGMRHFALTPEKVVELITSGQTDKLLEEAQWMANVNQCVKELQRIFRG